MSYTPLSFNNPPELSDQTASQLLDMLYGLAAAVENHYRQAVARPPLGYTKLQPRRNLDAVIAAFGITR